MKLSLRNMKDRLCFSIFLLPTVAFMLHGCNQDEEADNVTINMACPSRVGTNISTGICLTDNPVLQKGACYNISNDMAMVTCIPATTDYVNFTCPTGSEDKCIFDSSSTAEANSSAPVTYCTGKPVD